MASLQKRHPLPKVAVVGIGHELCGDDGAGVVVANLLQRERRLSVGDRWLVIDGGSAPENCTGALRRFTPDLALLIDAARMDELPGTVRCLELAEIDASGFDASTHSLPLHTLAHYLNSELGCSVTLLGIQPACVDFDAPLTPAVRRATDEIALLLAESL